MGPLLVLMWKHMIVRKRRFIHTPIEYLSPIIYFVIMFSFKKYLIPAVPVHSMRFNNDNIPKAFSISTVRSPTQILYTPDTELTRQLMAEVATRMKPDHPLKELDHIPYYHDNGYFAYENDSAVLKFSNDMQQQQDGRGAIVIFQNLNEAWPSKLQYTIRMKGDFQTHLYDAMDGAIGPHKYFGETYEPFMSLQWAIDSSYLRLLTGGEIPQRVLLQEFPYSSSGQNTAVDLVIQLLGGLCALALGPMFVFFVSKMLQEKNTGVQEMIKMVGVSNNQLCVSHFLNVLPGGVLYCVAGSVLLKATGTPLLPHTNGLLICVALFLHFMTVFAMALAFSYIFNSNQYVTSVAMSAYICFWLPFRLVSNMPVMTRAKYKLLIGLLPHMPLSWFWNEVAARERHDRGVTFENWTQNESIDDGSVLLAYFYMLVQTGVFLALAWYCSLVRPGPYGVPLPWNFMFNSEYFQKKKVKPAADDSSEPPPEEDQLNCQRDPKYFEPTPDVPVGIKISNVTKEFDYKQKALSDVSFEALKGEITVLLGHNGAGKTTLMSIITGLIPATSGTVLVNGKDIRTQPLEVRQQLGLCPQHHLFFSDLTVLEHVMFYAMIKGVPYKQAQASSKDLLSKLNLSSKLHVNTDQLSGGMKRRVQLACALAGGAQVLILDEPTSGLDVETRRELWDLLLSLRGERTVLLTTHFMEEADALGDRVCALHKGTVRCHATTMFLKRAIGTGYRLSFTTIGAPNEPAITSTIRGIVPDACVKEESMSAISYSLPANDADKFPALFAELEGGRSALGIDSIGVGRSTLDEVFMKLCSDVDTKFTEDQVDATVPSTTFEKLSGIHLYLRQFKYLFKRQWKYNLHKWVLFLFHIIGTILMIFLLSCYTKMPENGEKPNSTLPLTLDIYDKMPQKRALFTIPNDKDLMKELRSQYKKVDFQQVPDIADAVLHAGREDILEYKKYLVGVELNDTDAKILFTTTVRHAAPVALNLLSNVLAARLLAGADGRTVTAYNDPVEKQYTPPVNDVHVKPTMEPLLLHTWVLFMAFILLAVVSSHAALAARERAAGTRREHYLCGAPEPLHWAAALAYHTLLTAAIVLVPVLIAGAIFVSEPNVDQTGFFGCLFVLMLAGSLSYHVFSYVVSTALSENQAVLLLSVFSMIFGIITPVSHFALNDISSGATKFAMNVFWVLFTPHTMAYAFMKTSNLASINSDCSLNRAKCANSTVIIDGDDVRCCASTGDMYSYYFETKSSGVEIIIMAIQFLAYGLVLLSVERGWLGAAWDRVLNARYSPPPAAATGSTGATGARRDDPMVRAEAAYVEKAIRLPKKQISEAVLAHDLHKQYPRLLGRAPPAVRGISFSVKKGECFGLLGVNGAGKSTTFKMLTAEIQPTRGALFANEHHSDSERTQYMRSLSYCPQFSGLDDFLTGRENLELVLTLRGLNEHDVKTQTDTWIQVVGLERYADKKVSAYSGGCSRRLAAAAALAQDTAAALLDEPTAGVDVAARRRVWRALKKALREGRSVVIASHSMDEMEALCDRICIMSRGAAGALGAPAALRARHAAGHALVIRLRHDRDQTDGVSQIEHFKGELHKKFDCTLKDEHQTMIHYHINDTMRYSELFANVESLRAAFPHLVEDYSVCETTLEEVFLAFARDEAGDAANNV